MKEHALFQITKRSTTKFSELLLNSATDYLSRGWPVIPLNEKTPSIRWKEFQTRLPSQAEVFTWFSDSADLPTGLGIVTGRLSGLVVVDCDSRHDAEMWQAEHGSSSLVALTGGGGIHLYYSMPTDEVRNRAHVFSRRIDIRGEGGYVAAPPSLHPLGTSYEWFRFHSGAQLPRFEPAWIRTKEKEITLPRNYPSKKVRSAWGYIRFIKAVSGEGGHNATFRAACKLRDAGLSEYEALKVLSDWNETNASPPWSSRELEHKIHSAFYPNP